MQRMDEIVPFIVLCRHFICTPWRVRLSGVVANQFSLDKVTASDIYKFFTTSEKYSNNNVLSSFFKMFDALNNFLSFSFSVSKSFFSHL